MNGMVAMSLKGAGSLVNRCMSEGWNFRNQCRFLKRFRPIFCNKLSVLSDFYCFSKASARRRKVDDSLKETALLSQ